MGTSPINLLKAGPEGIKKFLDSFDHVFSDCDGVLWTVAPLPGSGDFVSLMMKLGKTVHFVSNNSIRTKGDYERQFKAANIENGCEKLTIPSIAIAEYLKSKNFDKHVYCVAARETIKTLESYGFPCKSGPDVGPDYYGDYVQFSEDDPDIGAVVFDSDFKINLPKLYKATTYIRRPEVHFINGATDRLMPVEPGKVILGVGIFTDLVAEQGKREPILLGKPGKMFGEFAMKRAGVTDPSRVLFLGDMIEQDIGLGKATGFHTLLVLTNNTQETMMAHPKLLPDYYVDDLGSFVPYLQKLV